jgi:hypothetical protein
MGSKKILLVWLVLYYQIQQQQQYKRREWISEWEREKNETTLRSRYARPANTLPPMFVFHLKCDFFFLLFFRFSFSNILFSLWDSSLQHTMVFWCFALFDENFFSLLFSSLSHSLCFSFVYVRRDAILGSVFYSLLKFCILLPSHSHVYM